MKCSGLVLFAVVLCTYYDVINGNDFPLIEDKGEEGKIFWATNYTVMEGDNLTLTCYSKPKTGMRFSAYYWQVLKRTIGKQRIRNLPLLFYGSTKRKQLTAYSYYGIYPSSIKGTFDIKLRNVGRKAAGTYECLVATLVNRKPKKYYGEYSRRTVTVKCPPKIESKTESAIKLNAGQKLTLDCSSSGYPTPVFIWSRTDGRPLSDRVIKHNKGLLSINNVGQLERGHYKCVSSNIFGNDSRRFTVNITVRARIMTSEKSYATIGKGAVVKCVAVGIPRPKFLWEWYEGLQYNQRSSEDGLVGRFQAKDVDYFENSTSYLMINNVRPTDLHEYTCTVKNFGDTETRRIPLVGYAVPERPLIQTVASSTTSITLTWKIGDNDGGRPVTSVIIQYLPQNSSKWRSELSVGPHAVRYTIRNLKPNMYYTLRVIAVNEIGRSPPSVHHVEQTAVLLLPKGSKGQIKEEGVDMMLMVGGVAGGFLVLIVAIVIVCILMRNIQRNSAKKAAENAERLAKNANADTTTALINFLQHGGDRLSTTTGSGNTSDVLQLTTSNKWEFPRDKLVLQNVLGSGAFGIVMKAEAEEINGYNSGTTPVAVKFVKENESASAKKDLIAELELLKLIEPHKNVINLLGCCTRSEPLMVIVEFCAYGDLQSFLRSSRGIRDQYYLECYKRPSSRLTSKELLMFGTQIARGMAHLACLKVIHRDLAARNILVDENKVCKVSDFGFARDIYVEDHYTRKTAGGRFPIKWMAIESLLDGISTTKSDVWSFAIVLWEIITLGASPYPGMNSQEVVSFLQNGMRMDKPKHCSDELYNLLLDCWQVAAHRRPNFEMLARYLDRMCNDDFEYINMRTYDDHLYINFDGNTVSEGSNSASLLKQDNDSKDNSEESIEEKESN